MSSTTSGFHNLLVATGRGNMTCCIDNFNWFRLLNQYQTLAMNRFRWENLPEGVESRHIEQALYLTGVAMFFKDKSGVFRCLPAYGINTPDVYGDWVDYTTYGFNGINETKNVDEGVPIFENDLRYPIINHVYHFTELISEIDKTIKLNTKQQRRPYIINTTKDMQLSAQKFMEMIERDEYVLQDKGLGNKRKDDFIIEVLNTKAEFLIDKLNEAKHEIESDLLDVLGINNNSNQDKRERLLVDEVNINNGYILNNLDVAYKMRKEACKKINEMFGLDISVIKVRDLLDPPQEKNEFEKGEGEEIHE